MSPQPPDHLDTSSPFPGCHPAESATSGSGERREAAEEAALASNKRDDQTSSLTLLLFFSFPKQNIIPRSGGGRVPLTQGGAEPAVPVLSFDTIRLIRFQGSL